MNYSFVIFSLEVIWSFVIGSAILFLEKLIADSLSWNISTSTFRKLGAYKLRIKNR